MGAIFLPRQIKRIARAEAEAEEIRALSKIKISAIERRGLIRLIQQEGKRQENIERITARAIEDLKPDAKPEGLDQDWLAHFFEKCKLVSNDEMQGVWGRILAGEANRPGAFSKRTIELVATLSKDNARLFTALCSFGWFVATEFVPLVFDVTANYYQSKDITFVSLKHLDSIGLVTFDNFAEFISKGLPKEFTIFYCGQPLVVEFQSATDNRLPIGHVMLSKAGLELAPICGSHGIADFPVYVASQLVEKGLTVYSPLPSTHLA